MWTPTGPELRGSIVSFWTWNQTADGGMLSHWLPLQIQNLKFLWSLKEFCTVRHRPTSEIYYSPMSLVGPGRRVYWWVSDLGLKLKETMLLRSWLLNVGSPPIWGGLTVILATSQSCEHNITRMPRGNVFKFGANVRCDSTMNWLEFDGQRSEIKVTVTSDITQRFDTTAQEQQLNWCTEAFKHKVVLVVFLYALFPLLSTVWRLLQQKK